MQLMAKRVGISFLCLALLLPTPTVSAASFGDRVKDTLSDVLKVVAAQAIFAKIAPMIGLGPQKTDEEKQKEKEKKEEKKKQKELEKAEKEQAKEENAPNAIENPESHISMVQKWAQKGDVQAQCIMAYAYVTGQRVPQDLNMAHVWQNRAAEQNIPLVKNFLPPEYGLEEIPLSKLFAISGRRSHVGQYVKQDVKDAVRWSTLGAEEKEPMAIAYLSSAYYTGRGMPQDYKKALELAKSTDKDPLSLHVLIDAYRYGRGVDKDEEKSEYYARYLKMVVEKNDKKRKEKAYKKYDKEIKAGDLYGIVR